MHQTSEEHEAQRPWAVLILLSVAQFMVVLDITVVNVALPSIGQDLGIAGEDLQWVVTIYVLLTGGLLLLGGRIADVLARRAVFLAGLSLFTAASLLSGLAESGAMLIASRAAQRAVSGRALYLPGALLVVAGLVVLVYAIDGAAEHGWGSVRTLELGALALALLATFARVEARTREPLVAPAIWRVRSLIGSAGVLLGVTGILVGVFFLNSLYLQGVNGATAPETGLGFLPLAVSIGMSAHFASAVMPRTGSRVLVAVGLVLTAAGAPALAAAPDRASYAGDILPGLLAIGFGVGLVFPAVSVTAMSRVEPQQMGLAAGVLSTAHEIGAALGVAVLAAVAAIADAASHAGVAAGYQDGFIAAAGIALAL